jgi:hypothetical protein
MKVETREIWKIASPEVVVIHEATIRDASARLIQVRSSSKGDLPDKNTKGLSIRHVHEQRAYHESETLAVANLGIIKTEASQHSAEHLLTLAVRVAEHFNIGKAATNIFSN